MALQRNFGHRDIKINFQLENNKIEMEFKASQRAWVMNSRQPNSNEARQNQTEEDEQANLSQLEEQ